MLRAPQFGQDFRHAFERAFVEALGGADDGRRTGGAVRAGEPFERGAHVFRRHDQDDGFGAGERLGRIGGPPDGRGQFDAGQELGVAAGGADLGEIARVRPPDPRRVAVAGQRQRQRGAPAAVADDRDLHWAPLARSATTISLVCAAGVCALAKGVVR